jgi:hypothetical protein
MRTAISQPLNRKEYERQMKMCGLVIIRVLLEIAKVEERISKEHILKTNSCTIKITLF